MLVYDEPLTPFSLIAKINHKHRKKKRWVVGCLMRKECFSEEVSSVLSNNSSLLLSWSISLLCGMFLNKKQMSEQVRVFFCSSSWQGRMSSEISSSIPLFWFKECINKMRNTIFLYVWVCWIQSFFLSLENYSINATHTILHKSKVYVCTLK